MLVAYTKFCQILTDTKNAQSTFTYISNVVKPPYDYSDLLRWQWAQVISALDKLVHDLVRSGMLDIYQGRRAVTPKFNGFVVTLELVNEIRCNPSQELQIIDRHIILTNGYKAFQDPDKIADALSYIWNENYKWDKIAAEINDTPHNVKTFLKNIVIRRNQIVHEGDYDGYSMQRQTIAETDVLDVVNFVTNLGKAIFDLVK
jgi:hypothetical protein